MQLFGLVNTMLAHDRVTAERDLSIARYAVIPLSPNSGLIGWVPNCDTLHALIREYRCGSCRSGVGVRCGVQVRQSRVGRARVPRLVSCWHEPCPHRRRRFAALRGWTRCIGCVWDSLHRVWGGWGANTLLCRRFLPLPRATCAAGTRARSRSTGSTAS